MYILLYKSSIFGKIWSVFGIEHTEIRQEILTGKLNPAQLAKMEKGMFSYLYNLTCFLSTKPHFTLAWCRGLRVQQYKAEEGTDRKQLPQRKRGHSGMIQQSANFDISREMMQL